LLIDERVLSIIASAVETITADTKYKTYANGRTSSWTYLRTWNKENKKVFVKEEKILEEVEKVFASMQLPPKLLSEVIGYIKSNANTEQEFHKRHISELHSEHTKLLTRMDKLTDLFLDGDIDKKTHEEKRKQLAKKREEIMRGIENHNKADDNFSKTLIALVELASGALEAFKSSTTEEKRGLVN
jgi:hypothetical protein